MNQQLNYPSYSNVQGVDLSKFIAIFNPDKTQSFAGFLVSRVLLFAILASGLIFFIRLLSAGYALMTSSGDPGKTTNASKEITNAIVGLVIVLTSYFIIQVLQVIFGFTLL